MVCIYWRFNLALVSSFSSHRRLFPYLFLMLIACFVEDQIDEHIHKFIIESSTSITVDSIFSISGQ